MSHGGSTTRSGIQGARAPVYSVDFGSQAAGKRIATTKRRIRWRWGFANNEALSQGQTGIACRGEEHDVTMVWSLTSGKRQITMDGQEVHYASSRAGIVDFSWTMKGNHILKVVAYASPPITATPYFRQYDFFVDGQSFFDLPKVYELGLRGTPQAQSRIPGQMSSYGDHSRGAPVSNEDTDLQRAIQASLEESRRHLQPMRSDDSYSASGTSYGGSYATSAAPTQDAPRADLLDFGAPSAQDNTFVPGAPQYAPAPSAYVQPTAPSAYAQPTAPSAYAQPTAPSAYAQPTAPSAYAQPPAHPAYSQPPASYGYAPAPAPLPALTYEPAHAHAPPPEAYSAPTSYSGPSTPNTVAAPTHYQHYPSGQLLSPGVTSTASAPPGYGFPVQHPMHTYDDPFAPKQPTQNELLTSVLGLYDTQPATPATPGAPPQPNFHSPDGGVNSPQANLSMSAPLTLTNEQEEAPKSAFDKALSNLVNFDDISAPADKDIQEAMRKKREEQTRKGTKSKPFAPAANDMVGSGATLAQISQVKRVAPPKDPAAVMKPTVFHQDAGMAGALVIRGDGPPPLQPQGFGIVHGQGYYGSRAGY